MYARTAFFGSEIISEIETSSAPWTSSLPKISPRSRSLLTGVGPIVSSSPISKGLTLPISRTTAWQTSG